MGKFEIDNKNSKFDSGRFNFVGAFKFWGIFSATITILALVIIFTKGFNYGIDFAGGTEIQVKFEQPVHADQLRAFIDEMGLKSSQVQGFGDEHEFLVRFEMVTGKTEKETNELMTATIQKVTQGLNEKFATQKPDIRRVDSVGPQVGADLKRDSLLAMFYALILILVYIGLRFEYKYAPGAVLCLFHDVVVVLGIFSLMGKEINVQILAAILTIIGYDINDTIIVYDRIRENSGIYKDVDVMHIINRSVNETLTRTINTSVTVFVACVALFIFAGGTIKDFAFAMGIGVVLGTYSSIYVASPLIVIFDDLAKKFKERRAQA